MRPEGQGIPVSKLTGVPGWETEAEEDTLCFYASQVPMDGKIVEIGSEYGRSASQFLKSTTETIAVWSVDLFPMTHPLVGDLSVLQEQHRRELRGPSTSLVASTSR